MHESIAKAAYKGYTRKLKDRPFDVSRALCGTTRAAWLRGLIKSEARCARSVLLEPPCIEGEGKHAELFMIGVTYVWDEEQPDEKPLWTGFLLQAKAKTFSIDYQFMPVVVTHHLVERTMQRLGIQDPPTALRSLREPIVASTLLGPPAGRQALLPANGGAVIAVPDREHPEDTWALVTFVDEARLRPEQIREANYWGELAMCRLKADDAATPQAA